jgi:hypothetical protein
VNEAFVEAVGIDDVENVLTFEKLGRKEDESDKVAVETLDATLEIDTVELIVPVGGGDVVAKLKKAVDDGVDSKLPLVCALLLDVTEAVEDFDKDAEPVLVLLKRDEPVTDEVTVPECERTGEEVNPDDSLLEAETVSVLVAEDGAVGVAVSEAESVDSKVAESCAVFVINDEKVLRLDGVPVRDVVALVVELIEADLERADEREALGDAELIADIDGLFDDDADIEKLKDCVLSPVPDGEMDVEMLEVLEITVVFDPVADIDPSIVDEGVAEIVTDAVADPKRREGLVDPVTEDDCEGDAESLFDKRLVFDGLELNDFVTLPVSEIKGDFEDEPLRVMVPLLVAKLVAERDIVPSLVMEELPDEDGDVCLEAVMDLENKDDKVPDAHVVAVTEALAESDNENGDTLADSDGAADAVTFVDVVSLAVPDEHNEMDPVNELHMVTDGDPETEAELDDDDVPEREKNVVLVDSMEGVRDEEVVTLDVGVDSGALAVCVPLPEAVTEDVALSDDVPLLQCDELSLNFGDDVELNVALAETDCLADLEELIVKVALGENDLDTKLVRESVGSLEAREEEVDEDEKLATPLP